MEIIKLRMQVGKEGIFRLTLYSVSRDQEIQKQLLADDLDALGWPVGFFDRTYGALVDDPIERPAQLPLEVRDTLS